MKLRKQIALTLLLANYFLLIETMEQDSTEPLIDTMEMEELDRQKHYINNLFANNYFTDAVSQSLAYIGLNDENYNNVMIKRPNTQILLYHIMELLFNDLQFSGKKKDIDFCRFAFDDMYTSPIGSILYTIFCMVEPKNFKAYSDNFMARFTAIMGVQNDVKATKINKS